MQEKAVLYIFIHTEFTQTDNDLCNLLPTMYSDTWEMCKQYLTVKWSTKSMIANGITNVIIMLHIHVVTPVIESYTNAIQIWIVNNLWCLMSNSESNWTDHIQKNIWIAPNTCWCCFLFSVCDQYNIIYYRPECLMWTDRDMLLPSSESCLCNAVRLGRLLLHLLLLFRAWVMRKAPCPCLTSSETHAKRILSSHICLSI